MKLNLGLQLTIIFNILICWLSFRSNQLNIWSLKCHKLPQSQGSLQLAHFVFLKSKDITFTQVKKSSKSSHLTIFGILFLWLLKLLHIDLRQSTHWFIDTSFNSTVKLSRIKVLLASNKPRRFMLTTRPFIFDNKDFFRSPSYPTLQLSPPLWPQSDSQVFPLLTSSPLFPLVQPQLWRAPSTCWRPTPPPPPPSPPNDRTGTSWPPNSRTPSASNRRVRRPRPRQTRTRRQLTTQAATSTSLHNHTPHDPPSPTTTTFFSLHGFSLSRPRHSFCFSSFYHWLPRCQTERFFFYFQFGWSVLEHQKEKK